MSGHLTHAQQVMAAHHPPRKTVKFCKRCGGRHAGLCTLKPTGHGTRCRPDLVEIAERRAVE